MKIKISLCSNLNHAALSSENKKRITGIKNKIFFIYNVVKYLLRQARVPKLIHSPNIPEIKLTVIEIIHAATREKNDGYHNFVGCFQQTDDFVSSPNFYKKFRRLGFSLLAQVRVRSRRGNSSIVWSVFF